MALGLVVLLYQQQQDRVFVHGHLDQQLKVNTETSERLSSALAEIKMLDSALADHVSKSGERFKSTYSLILKESAHHHRLFEHALVRDNIVLEHFDFPLSKFDSLPNYNDRTSE